MITTFTYAELLREVDALAAVMQFRRYQGRPFRSSLCIPMVLEAVAAMLACARIGAVHSVVFGGFAARELATRIDDAKPKLVLSASCGLEPGRLVQYKPLLDDAIKLAAHKVDGLHHPATPAAPLRSCRRSRSRLDDAARCRNGGKEVRALRAGAIYIRHDRGVSNGVVRDNGDHLVAIDRLT